MKRIFHQSAEFVAKHKRHHHVALATLALIIASSGVYLYRHEFAQAATFTWTQNLANGGWGGGVSATTASHSVNGDSAVPPGPWTKYFATSSTSVLASGSGVSLAGATKSFIDDGGVSTFASTPAGTPQGSVFDTSGNLYFSVSDATVRKVTPGGTLTTFASTGSIWNYSMVVDASNNLFIASYSLSTVIKITPGGAVSTFATVGASPIAIIFDTAGNLYTANYATTTVSKITPSGTVTTFATVGTSPRGLAFDISGNLYVANYGSNTISKITPSGTVTTFATGLSGPTQLSFDTSGNLYVSNNGNATVSKITPGGTKTTFATVGTNPSPLVFDTSGYLYVGNYGSNTINKITPSGTVTTFATVGSAPGDLIFDTSGNLYSINGNAKTVSKIRPNGGFEAGANLSTMQTGTSTLSSVGLMYDTNNSTISVSTEGSAACAVKNDGTVYCWGNNGSGALGDNTTTQRLTPVQVHGVGNVGFLTGVKQVAGSSNSSCAVKTDGTAYCWGANNYGQLGNASTTQSNVPVQVLGVGGAGFLTGVSQIAGGQGYGSVCAVMTDGTVYCWGANGGGQLGDNTITNRSTPVQVHGVGNVGFLTGVSQIRSSDASSFCAVKTDNTAYCWGYGTSGQLGENATSNRSTPVQVHGVGNVGFLTGVRQIATGGNASCAVKTDGTVYCWGDNTGGNLGDNTTTPRLTPVQVLGVGGSGYLTGASQVDVGGQNTSCAVTPDGAVCWGSNNYGQLGDNTIVTPRPTPLRVLGVNGTGFLTGIVQVATGVQNTCMLKGDGTVYCWGRGLNGIIGDNGTGGTHYIPTQVHGVGDVGMLNLGTLPYLSSGTFTSVVIDLGAKANFTTFAYTTTLNGQTITMDVRAGDVATPDGTWTGWTTNVANGGSIAGLGAHQYIQYRANLSTTNTAVTPTLDSVTINYSQYVTAGNLTSSVFNAESAGNLVNDIWWSASNIDVDETVKFQIRSSSDGATWSSWCGPSITCAGTDYFTVNTGTGGLASNHPLRSGGDDQYFQYRAFLTSGGDITPILTSATVQYVVNAAPIITGVTASQNSNGTVTVGYDVSDSDNGIGNIVDVTLQYCTTGSCTVGSDTGWVNASAVSGTGVGVGVPLGAGKSITWTPATDYASQYSASQKIRVKANDRDAANNLGYGISSAFTLDTLAPSVTIATFDSTQDVVNLTTTDNSAISYRLCNATCSAEAWTAITTQGAQSPISWTSAIGAPGAETVYLEVKDIYSNITQIPLTAPATPGSFLVADVSNPGAGTYGETLSWIAPQGASTYNVYYATTSASTVAPSTYAPLAMGVGSNVYAHVITTATTSAYWYKVSAIGSGNTSNFATETSGDVPDSFGTALSDTTAPTVTSVATSSVLSTSAVVTVATNELASIQIFYSPGPYVAGCLYTAHTSPSAIYATSTVVTLTGLTASTTYNFCVKATDIAGNPSLGTSGVENSSFTTVSGPGMVGSSTFTVTSNTATINWTTSTTSDSYVTYGTPAFGTNNKRIGVSTYTTTTDGSGNYVHAITLTGLTAGTDYYYQVESSNALGTTIDTNTGAYYHMRTTIDITPPVITGTSTPVLAPNAAVVVWQTDEPATSKIDYGLTTAYGKGVAEDTALTIWHVMTLSSSSDNAYVPGEKNALTKETPYFYRVTSKDAANNTATADGTFTTPADGNVTITVVSVRAGDTKDTTPPTISNVTVSDITPFGATVKFGTDEDSDAFVKYGKDTSYGDSAGDDTWGTTHTIKLHGLTLGTDYHIMVTAHDKSGNTGTSADQTFKTTFLSENLKDVANVENIEQFQKEIESAIESILPSLVPPFVTKPVVSDITESGATVTFKTNIKAFPVVVYAEDGAYDETKDNPYTGEVSDTVTKDVSHTIALTGLKGNTKYHIQARGFSLPKVIGKSADVTFITKASKIAGSIVERKKDSFTVVWTTEEPTTSIVEFKDLKRGITERKVDEAKKKSHSMKIENLPSGTAYEVNLSGLTEQGNIAEAGSPLSVTTSTDTTAPTISGFKVDNALVPGRTDRIQTIVSWMTDEPANATVYYEEGAGTAGDTKELANKVESLDSYTANHSIILPNLKPGTIYRLKVTSSDDSGNEGSFGPRTVITPQQAASITDIIFKNFEDSFKFLRKI